MICVERRKGEEIRETWWWNKQVKEAIDRKKKAFKTWCKNRSAENKSNYRKARNRTRKVVAKAMKQAAEEEMKVLYNKSNDIFKLGEVHEKGWKGHK